MAGHEPYSEQIDRKTSRSICDAVGERLQQSLVPRYMPASPRLDRLIEEMRRREREGGGSMPADRGAFFQ